MIARRFHIQPWEMVKLTPWEHDHYVDAANSEIAAAQQGALDIGDLAE